MSSSNNLNFPDLPTYIKTSQETKKVVEPTTSKILPLIEVERKAILEAIEQLRGDKLLAARLLGIGKTTLYRKLKEYSQI